MSCVKDRHECFVVDESVWIDLKEFYYQYDANVMTYQKVLLLNNEDE